MTVHVMIDLETWGTLPGSALRSIGAVTFSPYGEPHADKSFYANITRSSCADAGLQVDEGTVTWWAQQPLEAQRRLDENQRSLQQVVHDFAIWWQSVNGTYVWSNGANFDEVLWRVAAAKVDHGAPWKYWNVRDTRTCWHLARLNQKSIPFEGSSGQVRHASLFDACDQAGDGVRAMKLPSFIIDLLLCRLLRMADSRKPDVLIGKPDDTYMQRWWVIPRNRVFNIYLHHFIRSDDDRALHDHPWLNASILLDGMYTEHTIAAGGVHRRLDYQRGAVKLRGATYAHRIELTDGPCWSLFLTGPNVREWGFHCPAGWRPWQKFVDSHNSGHIGRGCD